MMENYTFSNATLEDVPEIIQFCRDNLQPEWQFCAGAQPYPNEDLMAGYIQAGNPFVIARRSGELMGYQIASRMDGHLMWGLAHRNLKGEELAEGHAHLTAYLWLAYGEPSHQVVPAASEDNIADELNAALGRALEIYEGLK